MISLTDGATVNLGKDPKIAHLVLSRDYSKVSRMHCTVNYSEKSGKYFVTDCSSNGTYLKNKHRLPKGVRTPVLPGTLLLLADNDCKVELL